MTIAARRMGIRRRNRIKPLLWILALAFLGWLMVATTMNLGTRVAAATVTTQPR